MTSCIDKVLKNKKDLIYRPKQKDKSTSAGAEETTKVEKEALVHISRQLRGPSTTLTIQCPQLKISPFTLDLVNSIHAKHVTQK